MGGFFSGSRHVNSCRVILGGLRSEQRKKTQVMLTGVATLQLATSFRGIIHHVSGCLHNEADVQSVWRCKKMNAKERNNWNVCVCVCSDLGQQCKLCRWNVASRLFFECSGKSSFAESWLCPLFVQSACTSLRALALSCVCIATPKKRRQEPSSGPVQVETAWLRRSLSTWDGAGAVSAQEGGVHDFQPHQ